MFHLPCGNSVKIAVRFEYYGKEDVGEGKNVTCIYYAVYLDLKGIRGSCGKYRQVRFIYNGDFDVVSVAEFFELFEKLSHLVKSAYVYENNK